MVKPKPAPLTAGDDEKRNAATAKRVFACLTEFRQFRGVSLGAGQRGKTILGREVDLLIAPFVKATQFGQVEPLQLFGQACLLLVGKPIPPCEDMLLAEFAEAVNDSRRRLHAIAPGPKSKR